MRKAHVLALDWEGPFEIIEIKPSDVYMLRMGDGKKNPKGYVSEIKKYREGRVKEEGELVEVILTTSVQVSVKSVNQLVLLFSWE